MLLVDEQRQRAMLLTVCQFDRTSVEGISLHASLEMDTATTALMRPRTLDLLSKLLQASGGELERICIDVLQDEMLYAQVHLRDQYSQHTIAAGLGDALSLALQLHTPINVSDAVSARRWINLIEYGATLQQQLEAIAPLMQTSPEALFLKKEPWNRDFAQGLQGWQFLGNPECTSYRLDTQATHTGPASLAIDLRESPVHAMAPIGALVHHEGFLAHPYQGQRLRLLTHIKSEHIQQVMMQLHVAGPPAKQLDESTGVYLPTSTYETHTIFHPATDLCDWTRLELVIEVPLDAFTAFFNFSIEGSGKLWIDAVGFECVDTGLR
ncbi:bifunctional nuclease family protein [Ktedonosporobacter rubrisoli]|uniref:Bifunctional nuclease family protein n=1 Tax=Ktedonosporobacter rubrisoli TaxID=2509675 RepID=A0A4P6JN33_KTERU|nr:bifunctional nuclease domain-containing protein [Ktedonosporobacter rubrisoli]QBD76553.1 bifunctional nuclease family protein [Ktedonosporobacter rubrisoli]